MSLLFSPLTLRGVTFANRIFLSPMCQYSCGPGGIPTDWHLVHLGSRAVGGFGLVLTEASAVTPRGRISLQDAGIWSEAHIAPWKRITDFIHGRGSLAGMQLAHAGRKGSTYPALPEFTSAGRLGSVPEADGGWMTVGPSPEAFGSYRPPHELTTAEIGDVVAAFAAGARRAVRAGFDVIEIHGAHGYLIHEFLSPLSNFRTDEYGGDFDGRTRLLAEVVSAVRAAADEFNAPGDYERQLVVFVRLSGSDWTAGGWSVQDTTKAAVLIAGLGADLVDVSSGGNVPDAKITVGPGYQVPFADAVRNGSGVPTGAVGLITEPAQAEKILTDGSADAVLLARAALREPAWPLRAAHELGLDPKDAPFPAQYRRAARR